MAEIKPYIELRTLIVRNRTDTLDEIQSGISTIVDIVKSLVEKDNRLVEEELELDDNKLHLKKFLTDKGKFLSHKDDFSFNRLMRYFRLFSYFINCISELFSISNSFRTNI